MHVCAECGFASAKPGYCTGDGHPLVAATDPLLGTEVLRYRLARLLGEGGMGKVYLGVQPQIGSRVAIKILAHHGASDPELLERFFAEGRAVNLIRHENIAGVLDLAQLPDGRPLIVMEYIEGVTLGAMVRAGRTPLGGIVRVICDVLAALEAAHAIGIVHRDVKPDNILVTANGHAKVLDFGIAKLAPDLTHGMSPRTRTGALLGTPSYMAPEQISGANAIDARTDVYAAGVLLFEAMTGRLPFRGATTFDLMRAHLEEAPPSPRALRPELPAAVEAVILKALAKAPAARFQSAAEMATALERAAKALPAEAWLDVATRRTPIPTPRLPAAAVVRRGRGWIVAGVVAAIAAGGAGGAFALRGGETATAPPAVVVVSPSPPLVIASAPAPADAAIAPPPADAVAEADAPAARPRPPPLVAPISPPPAPARRVAGAYDPSHFDYRAYLPRAQAEARKLYPDALLTDFELSAVFPDGHVELAERGSHPTVFVFQSEAAKEAGTTCKVHVTMRPSGVTIELAPDSPCWAAYAPWPRCSFAWLWAHARSHGTAVTQAVVSYTSTGWMFSAVDLHWTFDEDCPPA